MDPLESDLFQIRSAAVKLLAIKGVGYLWRRVWGNLVQNLCNLIVEGKGESSRAQRVMIMGFQWKQDLT